MSATPALTPQNYFATSLSVGITTTDTTVYLASLPTGNEGYIEIDEGSSSKEIIYFTSKGANFVTLPSVGAGRGVGGTSAAAHLSGATAKMKLNAEYFLALQDGSALANNSITGAKLATNAIKLGYAQITANVGNTGAGLNTIGLSVTVTVPAGGRDIEITFMASIQNTTAANLSTIAILESSTVLESQIITNPVTNGNVPCTLIARVSAPSAGSHTYTVQSATSAGTVTVLASATGAAATAGPAYILVKAI